MPKKRKASKRSPKPAAKPKRKPGRPEGTGFHPTDEQRAMVHAAAGYRMPEDEIAQVIINPQTKKPISPVTLRKHFADEIARGYANLKMRIMAATVRNALGVVKQGADGVAVVESQGNVTAQIWLQKTLYGARELTEVLPPATTPTDGEHSISDIDAARRVAFVLATGAQAMQRQPEPKPKASKGR